MEPAEPLAETLVSEMVSLDLMEYERYGDLDFSMRKGMQYLRHLSLAFAGSDSLDLALAEWLRSVRFQSVWRYVYQWLSWQPAEQALDAQEHRVAELRTVLTGADQNTTILTLHGFIATTQQFPCPSVIQEKLEQDLGDAVEIVSQRWEQLEALDLFVRQHFEGTSPESIREALDRSYLRAAWLVLRALIDSSGRNHAMPEPPEGQEATAKFARRVMETLDAAGQMPHAGALYRAAHEFEKYPRLLNTLAANDRPPLEAVDLWFAKLLREEGIRFTQLERLYIALAEFRRVAAEVAANESAEELRRLIRHVAGAAVVYAFQFAYERDQTTEFRRRLGEQLDPTNEPDCLRRLLEALKALYAQDNGAGIEAALVVLVGSDQPDLLEALNDAARSLIPREAREDAVRVRDRASLLLEQTLRLSIYRPAFLRAPAQSSATDEAERKPA